MDYNTLSTFLIIIFVVGILFFVAFIGITAIVIGFVVALFVSFLPDTTIDTEDENYSVEQLVNLNKNFQDSNRIINSEEDAKKYKILSKEAASDDIINEYVTFNYKGKVLYTIIDKNKSLLCFKTLSKLGEIYNLKTVDIKINNESISKVTRSQSNIEYACDQDETIIENRLTKE